MVSKMYNKYATRRMTFYPSFHFFIFPRLSDALPSVSSKILSVLVSDLLEYYTQSSVAWIETLLTKEKHFDTVVTFMQT
jgi:hypothetical protein